MAAFKQLFGFERTAVQLESGGFFQPLKEASARWSSGSEEFYRAAGHRFAILYQLVDGEYVIVQYSCCDQQRTAQGGLIWVSDNPPQATRIPPAGALRYLIDTEKEIPEALQPYLQQIYDGPAGQPVSPPRALEHWSNSGLLGSIHHQPAHLVDPLEI